MDESRENDLRMLREALELGTLDEGARVAFSDMLSSLEQRRELSDKQRAWVRRVLDEPDYQNLVSSGAISKEVKHWHPEGAPCTSTCPAWTPPSLASLPKKPPTRRAGGM